MNVSPQKMRYDVAKTVFSPDGRLFQVEYAREAVKKGATSLGITYEDGVVLAAVKQSPPLQVERHEKVFEIDTHAAVTTSGLVSDGRILVQDARQEAQRNRMLYDEPYPMNALAKFLADRKQMYTQYGGVRPYGVAMLVGGVSGNQPELYQTDPSGVLKQWQAVAIGRSAETATNIFNENYEENMGHDDAVAFTIDTLHEAETEITLEDIECAVVSQENGIERLDTDDITGYATVTDGDAEDDTDDDTD